MDKANKNRTTLKRILRYISRYKILVFLSIFFFCSCSGTDSVRTDSYRSCGGSDYRSGTGEFPGAYEDFAENPYRYSGDCGSPVAEKSY